MALTDKQIEKLSNPTTPAERLLEFFKPRKVDQDKLATVEGYFVSMGNFLLAHTPAGPEQTVAMRHLLDAKHAAVRSLVQEEADRS